MTQNTNNTSACLDRPEQIVALREFTIYRGLKFEISTGLKLTRGSSCYTIAKTEYGLRGNRMRVLLQLHGILTKKYPFLAHLI